MQDAHTIIDDFTSQFPALPDNMYVFIQVIRSVIHCFNLRHFHQHMHVIKMVAVIMHACSIGSSPGPHIYCATLKVGKGSRDTLTWIGYL